MGERKKVLLAVPPNYSLSIMEEEIRCLRGETRRHFSRALDWRCSAPLGGLFLAASARKAGHEVRILDLHREFGVCRSQGYFGGRSLADFFSERFGGVLSGEGYDFVGISCLFNVNSTTVSEMCRTVRAVSPGTAIVLGGNVPTNMPEEVIRNSPCDYLILGEGEEDFAWLLDHAGGKDFSGSLGERPAVMDAHGPLTAGKRPRYLEDLDSLPMPAWDLLPFAAEYVEGSLHAERMGSSSAAQAIKAAGIMTTRGCPMRCSFCAAHGTHGRRIRSHSLQYVMRHVEELVEMFGINRLLIEDDMFNHDAERTIGFCRMIWERYGARFTVEFPNGLAIWNLREDVVDWLAKIGMRTATVAIESGNAHVQKHILRKNLDLGMIRAKVAMLKERGISVRGFFIVGFVGETLEMMRDTVDFALELELDWAEIKAFTPLMGSEMYTLAREMGVVLDDTSEHVYGRCSMNTPDFTAGQVDELRYDANIRVNFLNNTNLRKGNFAACEKTFAGILRVYPEHLFAQWGLWQALERQGRKKEADAALSRLRELRRSDPANAGLLERYGLTTRCLRHSDFTG